MHSSRLKRFGSETGREQWQEKIRRVLGHNPEQTVNRKEFDKGMTEEGEESGIASNIWGCGLAETTHSTASQVRIYGMYFLSAGLCGNAAGRCPKE